MRPVFSDKAGEQLKDWRPNQRAMRKIYSLIEISLRTVPCAA
jgi:hypothetical protein